MKPLPYPHSGSKGVTDWYILKNREVHGPVSLEEGGRWMQANNAARIVKQQHIGAKDDSADVFARVSTVFLGLDHRFGGEGPPLVFETMVFGGGDALDGMCERCSTWREAEKQHQKVVKIIDAAYRVSQGEA